MDPGHRACCINHEHDINACLPQMLNVISKGLRRARYQPTAARSTLGSSLGRHRHGGRNGGCAGSLHHDLVEICFQGNFEYFRKIHLGLGFALDGDRLGQFQIDTLLVIGSGRNNQAFGRIVSSTLSTKQQN